MASTPRRFDSQTNQWVDGDALFMACNVWRQAAENVANSLTKGDRVIVTGRLRQRSFENREGERRSVIELEVDEVGPALKYATAQVQKTAPSNRSGGQGGNFGGNGGGQSDFNQGGQQSNQNSGQGFGGQGNSGNSGNGGNQGFGGRNASRDDDPWNSAPQSGFGGGDEDPPF